MNINSHPVINECTSCQMCAAVCSRNAIAIRLNEDGFYRPYVDENICTDCGLCTLVCYKYDNDIKVTSSEDVEKIDVYSAQHVSDTLLEKVTSGGVADVLAKELIDQGFVCVGVTYNEDNHRAEHIMASARLGQYCTLRPGVVIGKKDHEKAIDMPVRVGDNVNFGLAVRVFGKITIGTNVTIGANSVVTKDIPDNAVVGGVPAEIIKIKKYD